MHYTIERPKITDALELATMHNQSWIETYPNDAHGITQEYIENRVANRLSKEGLERRESGIQLSYDSPTYFLRIAKNDSGKIVGFIDGHIEDGKYWLGGLYTLKSTHGTGLAQLLWGAYLPWTEGNDIVLTVVSYNERAKAFYKKLGFTEEAGSERKFSDTPLPVIDMVRKN